MFRIHTAIVGLKETLTAAAATSAAGTTAGTKGGPGGKGGTGGRRGPAGKGKLALVAAAALLGLAAGVRPASAGLTELHATPYAEEQSQAQILSHTYGGTFVATGNGFSNGVVTASRIDDLSDVAWKGTQVSLTPIASFAGSSETLGLLAGTKGGSYQSLFSVNQFGYQTGASTTTLDLFGKDARFSLTNSATALRSSSMASDNGTGDQSITYKIDGVGTKGDSTYLMFWEDSPLSISDRDYNDLVVQAKFAGNGGPHAVPLPPAAAMGLLVMGGAVVVRKWKQRRRAAAAVA